MSNVEEWARLRAEEVIPAGRDREFVGDGVPHAERIRYADGLSDMAALLLSDEAVEAGARGHVEYRAGRTYNEAEHLATRSEFEVKAMRSALQAALDKITETP